MKCRLAAQSLRLRIDEDELERLLREGAIEDTTAFAPGVHWRRRLRLDAIDAPTLHHDAAALTVTLPRGAFEAFAAERPRRDGIDFVWPVPGEAPLRIGVEIDVRDSHRRARGDRREPGSG